MPFPTKKKILIFIVAYNAENHILSVFSRIPETLFQQEEYDTTILVIDDASPDRTFEIAQEYAKNNSRPVTVLKNPLNLGYGGNQKMGYQYAIENFYDIVVLLHGDGQYAPEILPDIIRPLLDKKADCVLGSRMVNRKDALKGGMPLYKWLGNILLTKLQNKLLKMHLSEFHTGYRAFSVNVLKNIPFSYNSDWFDFDTEILIQINAMKFTIAEIAIPTHYGTEICHVNGLSYAGKVLRVSGRYAVQRFGILYDRRFDFQRNDNSQYTEKTHFESSHSFAIQAISPEDKVLEIGCDKGFVARILRKEKLCMVAGCDLVTSLEAEQNCDFFWKNDLEHADFSPVAEQVFDHVLLLDVIEHVSSPEDLLDQMRTQFGNGKTQFIFTTPNIAFGLMRVMLLIGKFNYGSRGILDRTHKRLFTFKTFQRILRDAGYKVTTVKGIPAPFELALGNTAMARFLLRINHILISINKGLFSFQIAVIAIPRPTLDTLLAQHQIKE